MYDAGPKWIKQSASYRPPEPKQRVSYNRNPTAPSIPGRHQSYGYEESSEGRLVMQRSPERIHTGAKLDTVGPGDYELAGSPLRAKSKAPAWGNSKTDRSTKYGSLAPGPGAYNLKRELGKQGAGGMTISIGGVEVTLGGNNGTSSFASKQARPHQKVRGVEAWVDGWGHQKRRGEGLAG